MRKRKNEGEGRAAGGPPVNNETDQHSNEQLRAAETSKEQASESLKQINTENHQAASSNAPNTMQHETTEPINPP